MASDIPSCQGGTPGYCSGFREGRTGPGPGAAAPADMPVWVRAGDWAF